MTINRKKTFVDSTGLMGLHTDRYRPPANKLHRFTQPDNTHTRSAPLYSKVSEG